MIIVCPGCGRTECKYALGLCMSCYQKKRRMIEPPAWFQFVGLVPLFVFVVQYPDVVREYFRFVLGGGRVC